MRGRLKREMSLPASGVPSSRRSRGRDDDAGAETMISNEAFEKRRQNLGVHGSRDPPSLVDPHLGRINPARALLQLKLTDENKASSVSEGHAPIIFKP